ncbi:hypothetical protein BH11MYX2_BH11MYX2_22740 [soil metagenome]
MENESLRKKYDTTNDGILVNEVVFGSSSHQILHKEDVIVAIDGHKIGQDGSIQLGQYSVNFSHLISAKQVGDTVNVEFVRKGSGYSVAIVLKKHVALVPLPRAEQNSYVVLGGLVFIRLTGDYMKLWPEDSVHYRLKKMYYDDLPITSGQQVVLVGHVLAHDVNAGYHSLSHARVLRVNGYPVSQISDVICAVRSPINGLHEIELENRGPRVASAGSGAFWGNTVVLDAQEVADSEADLLAIHNVPRAVSVDLADVGST